MEAQLTKEPLADALAGQRIRKSVVQELAARREELTRHHPDQWIALYREGDEFKTFAAASLEELIHESDNRGLDRNLTAIGLLETKKKKLIL